jgi:hypothetical protein
MIVGFSTGSLARGDVRCALRQLAGKQVQAVELSALRESELPELVAALDRLDLSRFQYVSVHAPSRLAALSEPGLADLLQPVFDRGWPAVLHPDVLAAWELWRPAGGLVCIENMDKRKPVGRTASELEVVFRQLPQASLCFDLAHARQIDPTMLEAKRILRLHGSRIRQIHLSGVASSSQHQRLGRTSIWGFREVAALLPQNVPVILETPVAENEIDMELELASATLTPELIAPRIRVIPPRIISSPAVSERP